VSAKVALDCFSSIFILWLLPLKWDGSVSVVLCEPYYFIFYIFILSLSKCLLNQANALIPHVTQDNQYLHYLSSMIFFITTPGELMFIIQHLP
jgi:hypothetical protein